MPDRANRDRHVVVVGGGPTGVELAGLIPDVLRGVRRDFRHVDPSRARIVLIEAGPANLSFEVSADRSRVIYDRYLYGIYVKDL